MSGLRFFRVTFDEASRLTTLLRSVAKNGPYKEVRASAKRLIGELQYVRNDVDYSPNRGYQVILRKDDDVNLLTDMADALGITIKD
jgi:hypothetical protein